MAIANSSAKRAPQDAKQNGTMAGAKKAASKKAAPKAKPSPKEKATAKKATAAKGGVTKSTPKPKTTKAKAATKAAATKKTAAKATPAKKTATAIDGAAKKRKSADNDADVKAETDGAKATAKEPSVKKARVTAPPKPAKKLPKINDAPTKQLHLYVFGEGSSGELGLGVKGNVIDVKRPRLNPLLEAGKAGVVQISTGGMHCVALLHDGSIFTWGVNDQGALGRDTSNAEIKMKDADKDDDDESDDDDENGLNSLEATPTKIEMTDVPEGTVFTQVAAGDSITIALTQEGQVFGCGTFRSNEGILGFSEDIHVQKTLRQIKGLKNIQKVVCGANHVMALDSKGNVFAWGSGQQNQLGRRVVERTRMNGLQPREFGLPRGKITHIACGAYHSFAVDSSNQVWAWGLNSYGETGVSEGVSEDESIVLKPTVVESLTGKNVTMLTGGSHHSMAVTTEGECLIWGRMDGGQMGIPRADMPDASLIKDDRDSARILMKPTPVPGVGHATFVAASSDTSMCLNKDGKAYTWGFSVNYQTGQGTDEDIETATLVDNTAVKEKKLVWGGLGGQFGMLASEA